MDKDGKLETVRQIDPKVIAGVILIIFAIVYLIISSSQENAQYFLTIKELKEKGDAIIGKNVRISGAVVGESITYNVSELLLSFIVVDIPGNSKEIEAGGGLEKMLHLAVKDPQRARVHIIYKGEKPDLLRDEAQAIMSGYLDNDGTFKANEILLKCPSKYQDTLPSQAP